VKRTLVAFILILSAALPAVALSATEVRLGLAPRISLPKDAPAYTEDNTDLYGTTIALLTSGFLRSKAEGQLQKPVPSSTRVTAARVPNTSIISVVVSGSDDAVATSFASALIEQFMRYKREQKAKYYRDTINAIDSALTYVPAQYARQLEEYKQKVVVASMLDSNPNFERIEY